MSTDKAFDLILRDIENQEVDNLDELYDEILEDDYDYASLKEFDDE